MTKKELEDKLKKEKEKNELGIIRIEENIDQIKIALENEKEARKRDLLKGLQNEFEYIRTLLKGLEY